MLAELRGLRTKLFAYGAAWRVLDGSRKLHRDVAVSLAGACLAAAAVPRYEPVTLWGGNDAVAMTPGALEADETLTRQVSAE